MDGLTVLSGLVNASHGAVGQNLEMVADPNTAVEQLLLDTFSDWMRSGSGCTEKRPVVVPPVSRSQRKVTAWTSQEV